MTNTTPLPLRSDTILGVCEAIGRDFGFNPLWLRLVLIVPVFFAPVLSIAAYLGLGLLVGLVHWLSPDEQTAAPQLATSSPAARADAEIDEAMPIAA